MSVETFSEGEYLPSVRQVVQDLHSFGMGVKHIGQTMQTVLKHLVGIEGVQVPSESSNRRMILESNLLAKQQVGEKMLSHGLNTLHFDDTNDAQKHFLEFQISTPGQYLSLYISETIRGDSQTQVDTLEQVFNDLSDVMSSNSTEENKGQIYTNLMLQKSVLSDINDENVYQKIIALVIIGKIITTPFMKLVDSKTFATHILDLNKHFHQLQIDLKHWSSTIVFS